MDISSSTLRNFSKCCTSCQRLNGHGLKSHRSKFLCSHSSFEIELQATTTSMMLIPFEFGELALQELLNISES
jgi:hypothetical protein